MKPEDIPAYEAICVKRRNGETPTPLEFFVLANEPVGFDETTEFRTLLAEAITSETEKLRAASIKTLTSIGCTAFMKCYNCEAGPNNGDICALAPHKLYAELKAAIEGA